METCHQSHPVTVLYTFSCSLGGKTTSADGMNCLITCFDYVLIKTYFAKQVFDKRNDVSRNDVLYYQETQTTDSERKETFQWLVSVSCFARPFAVGLP